MALAVCLSAFYVCQKHLWGRVGLQTVSSHENLRSNDSRRLDAANYVLLDVRRTADASRLSQSFHVKEQSVDPTRQVNMSFLRGSLHCELKPAPEW